jgi:phage tail tape-measure protein
MTKTPNTSKDSNPDPITGEPGSHPVGTGLGAAGGGATGATIGAVGGPVGMAVGAVIGAIAGGLAGKATAELIDPTAEDAYWTENHRSQPYAEETEYSEYSPAYRAGYQGYATHGVTGRKFEEVEPELAKNYESTKGKTQVGWDKAKHATRAAWDRVERAIPGDSDRDGK